MAASTAIAEYMSAPSIVSVTMAAMLVADLLALVELAPIVLPRADVQTFELVMTVPISLHSVSHWTTFSHVLRAHRQPLQGS